MNIENRPYSNYDYSCQSSKNKQFKNKNFTMPDAMDINADNEKANESSERRSEETSAVDIYNKMTSANENPLTLQADEVQDESSTETNIIVNADGSRVLVMSVKIGGMESTMSVEISKPTDIQNEIGKNDNHAMQSNANSNISQEMSEEISDQIE